jgi:tetratricopeptide (TPR) repeat protein
VTLLERAHAAGPSPALAGELAEAHRRLARSLSWQARFQEAQPHLQEARRLAKAASSAPGRIEDVLLQASVEQAQAAWHSDQSGWSEAAATLGSALDLLRSLPPEARARPDVRRHRLTMTIRLGDALAQLGRPDQSVATLDELTGDLGSPAAPLVAGEERILALMHSMAGSALLDLDRHHEAARRLSRGREVLEAMRRSDPANDQASRDLVTTLALLCSAETQSGRAAAAREACAAGLRIAEGLARERPGDAGLLDAFGVVAYHNGKLAHAERRFADALAFFARLTDVVPVPEDRVAQRQVASGLIAEAEVLADAGRPAEAEGKARRALEVLEGVRRAAPQEPCVLREVAMAQAKLARLVLARTPDPGAVSGLMPSALATLEALVREGMTVSEVVREVHRLRRELSSPPVSPSWPIRRG